MNRSRKGGIVAKNKGKQFEKDWKDSCPPEVYIERFKDSAMWSEKGNFQVKASKNPCDYIMYYKPYLFLLEMKSTKGTSFSFSEKIIKQHQINKLLKAQEVKGVVAGFLFNFRERETKTTTRENAVYFVPISRFIEFKESSDKKSVNEPDCRCLGIKVNQRKKITHFDYDVIDFIKKVSAIVEI